MRLREAVKRDLVEARAVNDQRSLDAERAQGLGDRPQHLGFGDAEQLHLAAAPGSGRGRAGS